MSAGDHGAYTVGGAVGRGGFYVPRRADAQLPALCRTGEFAYVLAPRQLGKTSLMIRTAGALAAEGVAVAILDLTAIGTQVDADSWYFGLLYEIGEQLGLTTDVAAWWSERQAVGITHRFTLFFREVLLTEVVAPVAIFVDEIDTTLNFPFADDFFLAIRALYEAREHEPSLRRLTFVLLGVADTGALVGDRRRSPFNIGQRVELGDFTAAEAQPLAAGLGLPADEAAPVLAAILSWTDGHPYLTQRLCRAVREAVDAGGVGWTQRDVDRLVEEIFCGPAGDHDHNLQFVQRMLTTAQPPGLDGAAVLSTYYDVWRGRPVQDQEHSPVVTHLKLSGVVKPDRRTLRVRNRIYGRVFDGAWVRSRRPPATLRVLLAQPLVRAGLAGLVVALLVAGLSLLAWQSAITAERQTYRVLAQARAALAAGQVEQNPELSLLLAAEAVSTTLRRGEGIDPQAEEVLHLALAQPVSLAALPVPGGSAVAFSWSLDSRSLVAANNSGVISFWDMSNHMPVATQQTGLSAALALASAPDNRLAAIGSAGLLRFWRADGQAVAGLQTRGDLLSASFSRDARLVVTVVSNTVQLWDTGWGGPRLSLAAPAGATFAKVALSPDGKRIATADEASGLAAWEAATGRPLWQRPSAHESTITALSYSADGTHLATGSADGRVRVWQAQTGEQLLIIYADGWPVSDVAYSPDGSTILTTSWDYTGKLWNSTTGQKQATLRGHGNRVTAGRYSPDGLYIATAAEDGTVRLWPAGPPGELPTLAGHPAGVWNAAYSPNGANIATAGADGAVRLWDAGDGRPHATLIAAGVPANGGLHVAYSPNGSTLLISGLISGTNTALIRSANGAIRPIVRNGPPINRAAYSPDGRQVVLAYADGSATILPLLGDEGMITLRGHSGNVYSAEFSPDGRQVVTAGADGTARVWDAASGRELRRLDSGDGAWVRSAAYSPDGLHIVTAQWDGKGYIWEAATGRLLHTLAGHAQGLNRAVYSPAGDRIASAGADGTARIWDAGTGEQLMTLRGHSDRLWWVAYSADGRRLLTTSRDGTVRQYMVAPADLLALAAGRVRRTLTPAERATYLGEKAPSSPR